MKRGKPVNVKKIYDLMAKSEITTVYELSKKTGIHTATLYQIFNNKVNPSLKTLIKLANAFGVSVSDLIEDEGSNKEV